MEIKERANKKLAFANGSWGGREGTLRQCLAVTATEDHAVPTIGPRHGPTCKAYAQSTELSPVLTYFWNQLLCAGK